jgi:hypothetical protein
VHLNLVRLLSITNGKTTNLEIETNGYLTSFGFIRASLIDFRQIMAVIKETFAS